VGKLLNLSSIEKFANISNNQERNILDDSIKILLIAKLSNFFINKYKKSSLNKITCIDCTRFL
jgi:hypothetical protein